MWLKIYSEQYLKFRIQNGIYVLDRNFSLAQSEALQLTNLKNPNIQKHLNELI